MAGEDNTVYIGNKQVMNYVTAVMTQFNEGDLNEVELMARGRAISRAVDVAEITRNRFLPDVEVENIEKGLDLVNNYGPEHFELAVENPLSYLGQIKNAGAIFLGKYSPEPLGDYYAGPNHVLPTGGTAKFSSPLTTDDFIKKSSLIYYNQEELEKSADDIIRLAKKEGLDAHAKSIEIRKRGGQSEGGTE